MTTEMTDDRWQEVEFGLSKLTPEEIESGWHFCPEWDYLLIGPGMGEKCDCNSLKVNEKRKPTDDD